jgi:prepilin-type processing-associated H-X9-DG protein
MLAARHVKTKQARANNNSFNNGNEDALGNVVFCDGHGGTISRKDAIRRRYTGSPAHIPDDGWN